MNAEIKSVRWDENLSLGGFALDKDRRIKPIAVGYERTVIKDKAGNAYIIDRIIKNN